MVPSVLITLTEIFTECCNALYIYRPEHKVFDTHTRSIFVHTKMCSYHNLLDVCARIGTLDTITPPRWSSHWTASLTATHNKTRVHTTEESRMSEPSMSLHQVRLNRKRLMRWNGAAFTWLEDCLRIPWRAHWNKQHCSGSFWAKILFPLRSTSAIS